MLSRLRQRPSQSEPRRPEIRLSPDRLFVEAKGLLVLSRMGGGFGQFEVEFSGLSGVLLECSGEPLDAFLQVVELLHLRDGQILLAVRCRGKAWRVVQHDRSPVESILSFLAFLKWSQKIASR